MNQVLRGKTVPFNNWTQSVISASKQSAIPSWPCQHCSFLLPPTFTFYLLKKFILEVLTFWQRKLSEPSVQLSFLLSSHVRSLYWVLADWKKGKKLFYYTWKPVKGSNLLFPRGFLGKLVSQSLYYQRNLTFGSDRERGWQMFADSDCDFEKGKKGGYVILGTTDS